MMLSDVKSNYLRVVQYDSYKNSVCDINYKMRYVMINADEVKSRQAICDVH